MCVHKRTLQDIVHCKILMFLKIVRFYIHNNSDKSPHQPYEGQLYEDATSDLYAPLDEIHYVTYPHDTVPKAEFRHEHGDQGINFNMLIRTTRSDTFRANPTIQTFQICGSPI